MYTTEELREASNKLPSSLLLAMGSFDTGEIVKSIGEQFHLHVDQVGKLSDEIRDTLFNLHNYADFKQNIVNGLQIPPEVADKIVTRVNNEIFLKIRELEKEEAEKIAKEEAGDYSHLDEGEDEGGLGEGEVREIKPSDLEAKSSTLPTANIFEEKMGKMFDLKADEEKPPVDPYREPIN